MSASATKTKEKISQKQLEQKFEQEKNTMIQELAVFRSQIQTRILSAQTESDELEVIETIQKEFPNNIDAHAAIMDTLERHQLQKNKPENLNNLNLEKEATTKNISNVSLEKSLRKINYSRRAIPDSVKLELLTAIEFDTTCDNLTFSNIELSTEDLLDILKAFKQNKNLSALNFNEITFIFPDEDVLSRTHYELERKNIIENLQDISDLIPTISHLKTVNFNEFCHIDSKIIPWFSKIIGNMQSLQHFSFLSGNHKLASLYEALKNHPTLTYLSLSRVFLTINESQILADLLKNNSILKIFILKDDYIKHVGKGKILFDALTQNQTLTLLDLSYSVALCEEIIELANAIMKNNTLTELSLRSCGINDDNAKILCEALNYNTSIKKLDLSFNELENQTDNGKNDYLINYLQNSSLYSLNLSRNRLGVDRTQKLIEAFSKNQKELEFLTIIDEDDWDMTAIMHPKLTAKEHPELFKQYLEAKQINTAGRLERITQKWMTYEAILSKCFSAPLRDLIWDYSKTENNFIDQTVSDLRTKRSNFNLKI